MPRRTPEKIISEINNSLKENKQKIYIIEYKKQYIKFNNGIQLSGDECKKYRNMYVKSSNIEYLKHHDYILSSNDILLSLNIILNNEKKRLCSLGGENAYQKNINMFVRKGHTPWNKGTKGVVTAWNKGLTKETSNSVLKISKAKMGEKNPMFGVKHTIEYKLSQSKKMKKMILDGTFTPNAGNRYTHFQFHNNGIYYRSSWELNFHELYPNLKYEQIRIPYVYNMIEHVYITDFIDEENKKIYEIKPSTLVDDEKVKAKTSAAIVWCEENGYTYHIITELDEPRMLKKK